MSDPFGLMKFAECEHQQLKCEKCGARSDIRGWSTFTGQDREMLELREENESLTARLAEAEALLLRWHTDADGGGMDGVDCELMSDTDEYVLKHMPEAAGGCDA